MKKQKGLKIVCLAVAIFAALLIVPSAITASSLPEEIYLVNGNTQVLDLELPFSVRLSSDEAVDVVKFNGNSLKDQDTYNLDEPITISTEQTGTAEVTVDLLGLIPVKTVKVTVDEERSLVPGGESIGVMLYTKGALVVGTMDMVNEAGEQVGPAKDAGIVPGDVIETVEGQEVADADSLAKMVNSASGEQITLGIRRDDQLMEVTVTPERDAEDGKVKLGVWVRDSTAGVGTLTFYDPSTGKIAGLGHSISDIDTGSALTVKDGEIIFSDIIEIVKGEAGEPGALKGTFETGEEVIGNIEKNTDFGIFGTFEGDAGVMGESIPAASRDEVHTGDAELLCTLDDEGVKSYHCTITKVTPQSSPDTKSFVIKIDDEELLSKTNGIVQGMSGSPVLQDGKLIGAVTHVFVDDPTQGYGIYIDWMLNEIAE